MRKFIGVLALVAAVVLVGVSATTLFLTAFEASAEPWQQWLRGAGVAAIVGWEAGAILLIGYCFRERHIAVGIGALVALILAMGVTLALELKLHVGSQADLVEARDVKSENRLMTKTELEKARARRDALYDQRRLTDYQRRELNDLKTRISALETKWDAQQEDVQSAGMAEAAWAHRYIGMSDQFWRDTLMALPLLFWTFARVFAVPLAVVGLFALKRDERPRAAAKASEGSCVAPVALSPVLTPYTRASRRDYEPTVVLPSLEAKPAPEPDPTPPADAAPSNMRNPHNAPVETPPARPVLVDENWKPAVKPKGKPSKLAKFADIDAPTKAWLDTGRAMPVALSLGSSGPDIWDAYNAYCLAQHPPIKPLNPSHFGRSLRRVGVASAKTARGVRYALKLVKMPVRRAA